MAAGVTCSYSSKLTTTETYGDSYVDSGDNTLKFSGLDQALNLTGGTTPAVSKQAAFQKALTAGAGTVDLRALVGANGGAIDGNGLKVRVVKFRNLASNANAITITFGASNPYDLLGSTFVLTLLPGQEFLAYLKDGAPTIDSTHKTIDLSGTGSQVLECHFVLG